MAKGGSSTSTTTQSLAPEQSALLNRVIPVAKGYISPQGHVNASTFAGPTVAPLTPEQLLGQQMALSYGQGAGQNSANSANTGLDFLTSGRALDPNTNPGLQGAINAAIRPITENYTNNVLGNIRDNAQLAGQFGYNRQGLEDAAANRDYLRQVGDTSSSMVNTNYQTGLDAMTKSLAFAPGVLSAGTVPATTVAGVGEQNQQQSQAEMDAAQQAFYAKQFLPLSIAQQIAELAFGIPAGSASTTTTGAKTSPLMGGLGGAASGAALGSAIPDIGTGVGAGVGGALGALLAMFG